MRCKHYIRKVLTNVAAAALAIGTSGKGSLLPPYPESGQVQLYRLSTFLDNN